MLTSKSSPERIRPSRLFFELLEPSHFPCLANLRSPPPSNFTRLGDVGRTGVRIAVRITWPTRPYVIGAARVRGARFCWMALLVWRARSRVRFTIPITPLVGLLLL